MKITDSLKCLITNYHVLNPETIILNIELEIWNSKKILLNINDHYIKYFDKPKDITVIEIQETDELYKDIEFLNYDPLDGQQHYSIYKDKEIFTIQHPLGNDSHTASGKITNIIRDCEFNHTISTTGGSSGCPIILLNNNQVIGIHKGGYEKSKINAGTFIGVIIDEIIKDFRKKNNYIISEINIKDNDVNKDIRILNSYEEYMRKTNLDLDNNLKNEEEIKECEIKINDQLINFSYYHRFKRKGIFKIRYIFKKYLNKINHMFYGCSSLIKIDLSNFNTENISCISQMFYECSSLTSINLSYLNTQKVTDMNKMFFGCKSLPSLNLSSFNTQNVTDMSQMFFGCSSLTSLDLSNFNVQNVANIRSMFSLCSSLRNINLDNFEILNVDNMSRLFYECSSLIKLDLSKFNTKNVKKMSQMFF